ncbi:LCP family protein [Levilactobacillus zymae]|uniref:Cell envelope-associated transcriptional attenuator LytR-CpsA-Psr, subfamily F2 (As in PMID19099556) n=1 Tax=Levilactobacillus zymae TaxID=267363 RepID=A0A1Y6JUK0_9LACO|nr:LCP family protein [Levilactobacillus zymae]SMS13637.1 Cell envelope-associated transcriptional attenuator LytR-CpsA-Psr, subfamily F2 (as in PMID19099556) [Levilactobacillus zymae]
MPKDNENNRQRSPEDFEQVYDRRADHNSHFKTPAVHPHRPMLWIIVAILLVFLSGGLAYGYQAWSSAKKTFSQTYESSNISKSRNVSSVLKKNKPFSILMLGTDTGALGRSDVGRTDTIMVATINPDTETAYLTSIPRDTRVTVGSGANASIQKINAAYTIGGPSTAVQTVEDLLDIPIDFYAIINMGGLEKMVNAVGGVDVVPPLTFKYAQADVKKGGKIHLNGKQALSYSRMRYDDPQGDYGRQKRQRQVLQKLVVKAAGLTSITRYQQILTSLNGNLKTDLSFDDLMQIRAKYGDASHHIKSETLQGQDAMIDGLSYQVPTTKELKRVSNHIRKTLGLADTTKFTTDAINGDSDTTSSGSTDAGSSGYGY